MGEPNFYKNKQTGGNTATIPQEAIDELTRTVGQKVNLTRLLNRTEERMFHDGAPWQAPVYSHDHPRRKDGRYRTKNGKVLPSPYDSRKSMIDRAVQNRINRIRAKYNL